MVLKFNPAAPAAIQPPSALQKTPSALMMAPVSLTPLAPPAMAGTGPFPSRSDQSIAAERRQAFFAERQQQLLARLGQGGVPEGGTLTPVQRSACESVLQLVAAHAAVRSTT